MQLKHLLFIFVLFFNITLSHSQTAYQKMFGGTGNDGGSDLQLTSDGGAIIVGTTNGFGNPLSKITLVRLNQIGDTIWTQNFGSAGGEIGRFVNATTDGGTVFTGYSSGTSDVTIGRTDSTGNLLWAKSVSSPDAMESRMVLQTADGGFIFGFEGFQIRLMKTDANGDTLWTSKISGASGARLNDIKQTTDGGYIITGTASNSSNNVGMLLLKLDATGNEVWNYTYGGSQEEEGVSVLQTSDGGYIAAGSEFQSFGTNGDIYVVRVDSLGNIIWSKTYETAADDKSFSICQAADQGFVITGFTNSSGTDACMLKIASNGTLQWSKSFGGSANDLFRTVKQTSDGSFLSIGSTASIAAGNFNMYLVKCDSLGDGLCNETNLVTTEHTVTSIRSNATLTVSHDLQIGAKTLTSARGVAVTHVCGGIGIDENAGFERLKIYPNPFNDKIKITPTHANGELTIYDVKGKMIKNVPSSDDETIVDSRDLVPGVYFVDYKWNDTSIKTRIVKTE